MTKTKLPCPRCKAIGLEVTDHIYCAACKRHFKLPVIPRSTEVEQKVAEITFDFGGEPDTRDIVVKDRVSTMGDEWI